MEPVASTSVENPNTYESRKPPAESTSSETKKDHGGTFKCNLCPLEEHFDFKGAKPPFARQIAYMEDCYIMKDPFSLPNRGEVLVLGADCTVCNKSVCLGCSVFYAKRFCQKCAVANISHLPEQLHAKIKSIIKSDCIQ